MLRSVKVLAFAGARDVVGAGAFDLALADPCTTEELLGQVCARYPGLTPYRTSLRVAVNGSYALPGDLVSAGDEVALLPPVAGG
jgi:molybdopterin synthase catalytic subunit/molybdopterin synthase sulfur carrier subunit